MEAIRIQADAIIVNSDLVHRPGQIVLRRGRVLESTSHCSERADLEFPGSALSAGLVNAHTHLEFSDLAHPFAPGRNFPDWISAVVRHRRTTSATLTAEVYLQSRRAALQAGLEESRQAGVTLIGDIVTRPWSPPNLVSTPASPRWNSPPHPHCVIVNKRVSPADALQHLADGPSVVALPEMIGLDETRFMEASHWATELAGLQSAGAGEDGERSAVWQIGLSPHSPYSIHFPTALRELASDRARRYVTAMHVAESWEEREWLASGTGPFREVFEKLGVPADAPRASISETLQWLATRDRALLVHGNYLSDAEIDQVAQTSLAVVYCPRTHRHFSHREYPLQKLIGAGINVVLGTDSRASNPDLDLWNEVIELRRTHAWVSPAWAFNAVTQRAAESLGAAQHFGSLLDGRIASINLSRLGTGVSPSAVLDELTMTERPFVPLAEVVSGALGATARAEL